MLKKLWKEDGSCVLCQPDQIEEMKKAGYELEAMPVVDEVIEEPVVDVVEEVKEEPVVEEKKTTRRGRKPKAAPTEEKDIVLE